MPKKRDLVLDWDKRLGWSKNPFVTTIVNPPEHFIAGYYKERKKLNLFVIKKHGFGLVKGEPGTGKTMLLRWLEHELKKYPSKLSVRYVKINKSMTDQALIDLIVKRTETLLDKAVGLYSKLRKMEVYITAANFNQYLRDKLAKKRMVLLVDDAYNLSKGNMGIIGKAYDELENLHIIMASTPGDTGKAHFSSYKDFLKLKLEGLNAADATRMIQKRIDNADGHKVQPFTEEEIKKITKKANGNPKRILYTCQEEAIRISLDSERVKDMHQTIHIEKNAVKEAETTRKQEAKPETKEGGIKLRFGGITIKSAEEKNETEEILDVIEEKTTKKEKKKTIDKGTANQLQQLMEDYDEAVEEPVHAEEVTINDELQEISVEDAIMEEEPKKKEKDTAEEKENADLIEQLAKEFGK